MANKKISELPQITQPGAEMYLPIVDAQKTCKIDYKDILKDLQSGFLQWQPSVIDFVSQSALNLLTPAEGDRYIISDSSNINKIATYTDGQWVYQVPDENMFLIRIYNSHGYSYSDNNTSSFKWDDIGALMDFAAESTSNKSSSLSPNDEITYPTTAAVKSAIESAITGLWDDRGSYNASGNVYPSSGGSGVSGSILKGDIWTISVSGTLGGKSVTPGDTIRSLIDTPGQTASNWAIAEGNSGYVPENVANKRITFQATPDDDHYPSEKLLKTALDSKQDTLLFAPLLIKLAVKTANEVINNNSSFHDDNSLYIDIAANGIYQFEVLLMVTHTGGGTAGFKAQFTAPSGATAHSHVFRNTNSNSVFYTINQVNTLILNNESGVITGSGDFNVLRANGIIINGSTAGTLKLQWAQYSATAINTSVMAGSYLKLIKAN
jgi:hypothetical protein